MAHEIYVRTNQKLYFTSLILNSWKQVDAGTAADAQAQSRALREAALFHLYGAVLSLCHEIAEHYHLSSAGVNSIEHVLDEGLLAAEPAAELGELYELSRQPDSWLALLLVEYRTLFEPPRAPHKAKVDPGLALIQATTLEEVSQPLACITLEAWRQQLKALAIRFRESMCEY